MNHYNQIKKQVDELNTGAISAMKKIGKHNTDVQRMVLDSEQRQRSTQLKVAIPEERHDSDEEYDKADESESIRVGGKKGQQRMSDEPLET